MGFSDLISGVSGGGGGGVLSGVYNTFGNFSDASDLNKIANDNSAAMSANARLIPQNPPIGMFEGYLTRAECEIIMMQTEQGMMNGSDEFVILDPAGYELGRIRTKESSSGLLGKKIVSDIQGNTFLTLAPRNLSLKLSYTAKNPETGEDILTCQDAKKSGGCAMSVSLGPSVPFRGPAPLLISADVDGNGIMYVGDSNGPTIMAIRRKDNDMGGCEFRLRLAPGLDIIMAAGIVSALDEVRQLSTAKMAGKVMGLVG